MFEKLAQIEKSYEELTAQISSPEFMADMSAYAKLMKQHRSLGEIVEKYREIKKMQEDLAGAKEMIELADDDEMREMAQAEVDEIEEKLPEAEEELKLFAVCRKIRTTKRTLFSRSAPEPAAMKRRFLRRTFCVCTRDTPKLRAGKWTLWNRPTPASAV